MNEVKIIRSMKVILFMFLNIASSILKCDFNATKCGHRIFSVRALLYLVIDLPYCSFIYRIVFFPLWLFHAVVARGRFSLPAPSVPHDRHVWHYSSWYLFRISLIIEPLY